MVRNSLDEFIDKYPYFLNRSKNSNFYKSSKVKNTSVQRLYNDVYKVYESMHLNKRLLAWRVQDKPYDYNINFLANYPLIYKVYIYKDNKLIYYQDFLENERRTEYIYEDTIKNGMERVYAYKCSECGEIYHNTRNPNYCNNTHINEKGDLLSTIHPINTYKCSECGEIYYSIANPVYCTHEHLDENNKQIPTLQPVNIIQTTMFKHTYSAKYIKNNMIKLNTYQCSECGDIYYDTSNPNFCQNEHYNSKGERISTLKLLNTYRCSECGEIYHSTTNPVYCDNNHTDEEDHKLKTVHKVNIYKCHNCGQIYFSENPPSECEYCYEEDYMSELPLKVKLSWTDGIIDDSVSEVYVNILREENDDIVDDIIITSETNNDNETNTNDSIESNENNNIDTNNNTTINESEPSTNTDENIINTPTEEENVVESDDHNIVTTVILNKENNWETQTISLPVKNDEDEIINYIIDYPTSPNYTVELTDIEKHHTIGKTEITPPIYYNDDTIQVEDNSREYLQYHIKKINPVHKLYTIEILNNDKKVDVIHLDYENNWESDSKILPITDDDGEINDYIIDYDNNELEISLNNLDYIPPTTYSEYVVSKPLDNTHVNCIHGHLTTFNENDEIILEPVEEETDESSTYTETFIPIPQIPTNKFLIKAVTYDEYTLIKGYPEYDYTYKEYAHMRESYNNGGNEDLGFDILDTEYIHDYSLDELGYLNNIPRKVYNIINDTNLYPFTEPPFNNHRTEDDYYYMQRMLEYNLRMWWDNPVSLELWKNYSIESELINRERYLLKVFDEQRHPFDEESELVKCWYPEKWEHKDKFCDGNLDILKEYFFVNTDTMHPVANQNVTCYFSIKNSLGESVDEEFYVDVYKVHRDQEYMDKNDGNNLELLKSHYLMNNYLIDANLIENPLNPVTTKYNLSTYSIDDYNMEDYLTTFRFMAYKLNGDFIGSTDIILFLRNYYSSDIHVDCIGNIDLEGNVIENYDELMDGSLEYPYLTLEDALSNVTGNDNVVGVNVRDTLNKYYILTDKPLMVTQTVKIIGNDYYEDFNKDTHEYARRFVPRIVNNTNSNKFFNLLGGKNITLSLSNLRLLRGQISSYVGMNQWYNTNKNLNNYESVLIHGGVVILKNTFKQSSYYPFDNVHSVLSVNASGGGVLSNHTVYVKIDKDTIISKGLTNEEGEYDFYVPLDVKENGVYKIIVGNESDIFFESEMTVNIDVSKEAEYHSVVYPLSTGDTANVTLKSTGNNPNEEVIFYSYNDVFDPLTVECDSSGEAEYTLSNVDGKYLIYTTVDNEKTSSVKDEFIVESNYSLGMLPENGLFIKNLVLEDDGDLSYDEFRLSSNPTLQELNGVVVNAELEDDGDLAVSTFKVDIPSYEDDKISFSDAQILRNAFTSIEFDEDTGEVSVNRLGEFWKTE